MLLEPGMKESKGEYANHSAPGTLYYMDEYLAYA